MSNICKWPIGWVAVSRTIFMDSRDSSSWEVSSLNQDYYFNHTQHEAIASSTSMSLSSASLSQQSHWPGCVEQEQQVSARWQSSSPCTGNIMLWWPRSQVQVYGHWSRQYTGTQPRYTTTETVNHWCWVCQRERDGQGWDEEDGGLYKHESSELSPGGWCGGCVRVTTGTGE